MALRQVSSRTDKQDETAFLHGVPFSVPESLVAVVRDTLEAGATSSRVNSPPHTLQFQAMTLSDGTRSADCRFHFFDNSPPHSGQII
jgi:hypothetical protein